VGPLPKSTWAASAGSNSKIVVASGLAAFIETEKHLLTALPDVPPELATWAKVKVHGNCHVQFENCYYSAPFRLVHRQLWLKATETNVKLFRDLKLVAVHPRLKKPGARSTIDDHLPPEALAYKMQDPQWCLKQARQIGPSCTALIEQLFSDRVLDNLRAAQGIVGFAKKYGYNAWRPPVNGHCSLTTQSIGL